MWRL
jgi:hypothetical protein